MWTGGQGSFAQLGDEETQFLLRVTALSSNLFRTGAKVSLLNPTTVQCQEVNVVNVSLPRKILGCCRVIALLLRKVSINQTGKPGSTLREQQLLWAQDFDPVAARKNTSAPRRLDSVGCFHCFSDFYK